MEWVKFAFANSIIIGVSCSDFWVMTPWAFEIIMNARNSNLKLEHETHRYLAWHVAAFQRAKKLPSLKDWIYGNKNDKKEGIDAQSIKEFFQNYQAAKDYMECQE